MDGGHLMSGRGRLFLKLKLCCWVVLVMPLSLCVVGCGSVMSTSSDIDTAATVNPLSMGLEPVVFSPREPSSWTLPNGLTVLHIQDSEIPIVSAALYTRGGGLWEKPEEAGVARTTGSLMRRGGVVGLSSDELDLELEKLSASISTTIGEEFGSFSFSCLKGDLGTLAGLFRRVMREPVFEQDKIDLHKLQLLESIRRRKDDGDTIASLAFSSLIYRGSPYGSVLTSDEVRQLSRRHLVDWHKDSLSLTGALFAVTGDISRAEVDKLTSVLFDGWSNEEKDPLTLPKMGVPEGAGVYFIEAPFAQATVLIGQLGVPRYSEDHFAIKVFNRLFGMGLGSSRLYQRIRSELGLAYSVYGAINPGAPLGINSMQMQTKAGSAGTAIKESLGVLRDLQVSGVSDAELTERRRGVINSFVFANEDADSTLQRQALFRLYGYPLEYDRIYVGKVAEVTRAEVATVAQSRWDLSGLIVLVVGPKEARESIAREIGQFPGALGQKQIIDLKFDETLVFPDGSLAD